MSWEREPLWAKSRLFFERAFSADQDDLEFGLWCSFGLELLARAALASISPTLLAEPDRDHKHLLHALNREHPKRPQSIGAARVFDFCKRLFAAQFTEDDWKAANALLNQRNEELHSGAAAFEEYPQRHWLAGLYRTCHSLTEAMGESLGRLFGDEQARIAEKMIAEDREVVLQRVEDRKAAHRGAFLGKAQEEQDAAKAKAEELGAQLAWRRHHRVDCPACGCLATVEGRPFGKQYVKHEDDGIVIRQHVLPTSFACTACGLKLDGYSELDAAGLGGHYTRTTTSTPEDYYGLVDPENLDLDSLDLSSYVQQYLQNLQEYDNE